MLIYHADLGLLDRIYVANDHIEPYGLPMETLFLLNMIIGDAVVIWRAWVLWKDSHLRKLVFIPMVMLLTSFIFSIIALTCLGTQSFGSKSTIPGGSMTCQWGEPIAWAISLLTNITSTTLIAVKAWCHRQFLKSGLGRLHIRSRSEKVLLLLVESGFIYCFFWLSQLILFFDISIDSNVGYLYMVLSTMGDQISGVYPTAIIVLVNMQRSMADDSKASMHIDSGSNRTPRSQELSTMQFNASARAKSLRFPSDTQPSTMTFASPSRAESSVVASRYREDV
ncbi:hypothetical protein CPB85DRAFT_1216948 [Mucidula mucida]|nr:hypothetical protein CPB85DRAFT_1216948 [Mucidula mucida]